MNRDREKYSTAEPIAGSAKKAEATKLIPTILCGGASSRRWPVSRELHPKPFIQLPDGESLLQKAFLRAAALPATCEVLTVTNRELLFKTEDEFRALKKAALPTSYILEPFGRNTAAAVAVAGLQVSQHHSADPLLLLLAADHRIDEYAEFQQAVALACQGRLASPSAFAPPRLKRATARSKPKARKCCVCGKPAPGQAERYRRSTVPPSLSKGLVA